MQGLAIQPLGVGCWPGFVLPGRKHIRYIKQDLRLTYRIKNRLESGHGGLDPKTIAL